MLVFQYPSDLFFIFLLLRKRIQGARGVFQSRIRSLERGVLRRIGKSVDLYGIRHSAEADAFDGIDEFSVLAEKEHLRPHQQVEGSVGVDRRLRFRHGERDASDDDVGREIGRGVPDRDDGSRRDMDEIRNRRVYQAPPLKLKLAAPRYTPGQKLSLSSP
jgi:hypothetical protein